LVFNYRHGHSVYEIQAAHFFLRCEEHRFGSAAQEKMGRGTALENSVASGKRIVSQQNTKFVT